MDGCPSRLYRLGSSSPTDLVDKLSADSESPPVKSSISIAIKRNSSSLMMLYFLRFPDLHQVAVLSKDCPEVLVGEESLEDLLSVSMNLIPKTSWVFKAMNILLDDMVFSIGYLDHGVTSTSKIALLEVLDLTPSSSTHLDDSVQRIQAACMKYLGEEGWRSLSEVGVDSPPSSEAAMTQSRARRWVAALALGS